MRTNRARDRRWCRKRRFAGNWEGPSRSFVYASFASTPAKASRDGRWAGHVCCAGFEVLAAASIIDFRNRLQRLSFSIVKGIVQQKDLLDAEAEVQEPAPQLEEGIRFD